MSRRSGRRYPYETNTPSDEPADEDGEVLGDDEEEDEQEVTRCVCANDELTASMIIPSLQDLLTKEYLIKIDQGLFIQCDKCSVWQHGYCVGLFTNSEVPDKYCCELCRPELHVKLYDGNDVVRTLYKPVNERRKKVTMEQLAAGQALTAAKRRAKRPEKPARKERRHYNYDEQLEQALRESARESGVVLNETKPEVKEEEAESAEAQDETREETRDDGSRSDSRGESRGESRGAKRRSVEKRDDSERERSDDTDKERRAKRARGARKKKAASAPTSRGSASTVPTSSEPPLTAEQLVVQALKPRYVSDKASIYELRKRTGAILEWLGRSQVELEEEKMEKMELFSYKESDSGEDNVVLGRFTENLRLMEVLTEQILGWEERWGRYAP